jgi:hypothetical protein
MRLLATNIGAGYGFRLDHEDVINDKEGLNSLAEPINLLMAL